MRVNPEPFLLKCLSSRVLVEAVALVSGVFRVCIVQPHEFGVLCMYITHVIWLNVAFCVCTSAMSSG